MASMKGSYAVTTSLFLVIFLLTIFIFNKRNLEPLVSPYRDLFPETILHFSTIPNSSLPDLPPAVAELEGNEEQGTEGESASLSVPVPKVLEEEKQKQELEGKQSASSSVSVPRVNEQGNEKQELEGKESASPSVSVARVSEEEKEKQELEEKESASSSVTVSNVREEEKQRQKLEEEESASPLVNVSNVREEEKQNQELEEEESASSSVPVPKVGEEEDKKQKLEEKESASPSVPVPKVGEEEKEKQKLEEKESASPSVPVPESDGDAASGLKNCDLYMGRWVRDEHYPIYKPGSCPYVDEAFDCQNNGRPDSDYLKWRWQPDGCDIPRFNGTDFLRRMRGKRLMLVGDSMNRNQFESLICLLHESLPDKSRMREIYGHKITKGRGYFVFKFADYDCTVEFVRSHFLVKEGVRINAQGNSNPTLSIDRIDKTSGRWRKADILVFNTGHWWTHGKTARGKNYYKEGDYLYPKFDAVEAYRRALRTWAKWIDQNIKSRKKLVLYRGYSSAHFRGGDWDSGGTCNGETEPVLNGTILDSYPLKMKIVDEVIREMRTPVKLLNVTRLTNFRKDGHPSTFGKNLPIGRKVSRRRQDCSHWCLPGVPDAWNELIYANLVIHTTVSEH